MNWIYALVVVGSILQIISAMVIIWVGITEANQRQVKTKIMELMYENKSASEHKNTDEKQ